MNAQRPLYVALVPAWLADTLARNNHPMETAMDFSKLETIVSFDDVCFYFDYLRNIKRFVGELFDDMKTIDQHPRNVAWVTEKVSLIEPRVEATRRFYADTSIALDTVQVPSVVRKTNYVPHALRDDCLAIVGTGISSASEFDLTKFVRSTLLELEKIRTWDYVKTTNVFKTHTQVATDAA